MDHVASVFRTPKINHHRRHGIIQATLKNRRNILFYALLRNVVKPVIPPTDDKTGGIGKAR